MTTIDSKLELYRGGVNAMPNRVIKDSIWTSPTLADLSDFAQDQFPRWLLLADDWGCFDSNSKVVKGLCYPLRDKITSARIDEIKREFYEAGLLFIWREGGHEWGYFVSWDNHHNFCNKTNVDEGGKNQKHRRKTPEPPAEELNQYLQVSIKSWNNLGQFRTTQNKILNPNPNPNPNPIKALGDSNESPLAHVLESNKHNSHSPLRAWFEDAMWPAVPSQKKRGKEPTWAEVKKLNPDEDNRKTIIAYFANYYRIKSAYDGVPGEFFAEMQDPVRVIKYRRFLDELIACSSKPKPKRGDDWVPFDDERPRKRVYISRESYDAAVARGETNIELRLPEEARG